MLPSIITKQQHHQCLVKIALAELYETIYVFKQSTIDIASNIHVSEPPTVPVLALMQANLSEAHMLPDTRSADVI